VAAFATSADLVARYDFNEVAEMASDVDSPASDLANSARITAALEDASGRIESSALVGGFYTVADLAGLTGNSLSFLKRITCDLAYSFLLQARPGKYSDETRKQIFEQAEAWLKQLRSGQNIFNIVRIVSASVPSVDGPTAVEHQRLNVITERTHNFYPSHSGRLPIR
jgi:phage gp36-like protein